MMSAQILSRTERENVVNKLRAAEAELQRVAEQEEDTEAASDLFGVIEKIQEIILNL